MLELCDMCPGIDVRSASDRPFGLDRAAFGVGVHDSELRCVHVSTAGILQLVDSIMSAIIEVSDGVRLDPGRRGAMMVRCC
jgi:hypothetical protein